MATTALLVYDTFYAVGDIVCLKLAFPQAEEPALRHAGMFTGVFHELITLSSNQYIDNAANFSEYINTLGDNLEVLIDDNEAEFDEQVMPMYPVTIASVGEFSESLLIGIQIKEVFTCSSEVLTDSDIVKESLCKFRDTIEAIVHDMALLESSAEFSDEAWISLTAMLLASTGNFIELVSPILTESLRLASTGNFTELVSPTVKHIPMGFYKKTTTDTDWEKG